MKHEYSKIITYKMFLKLIEINRCSVRVKLILFSYLGLGRKQLYFSQRKQGRVLVELIGIFDKI